MSDVLRTGLSLFLQSTLLLSLGLMASWLLRRRSPFLRAFVLQMTLLGVALGSVLSVCLVGRVQPVWPIRTVPTLPSPIGMGEGPQPLGVSVNPAAQSNAPTSPAYSNNRDTGRVAGAWHAMPRHGLEGILPSLSRILATLWAPGAGLLLLWLSICQWHLVTLRRCATSLTSGRAFVTIARLSDGHNVRAPHLLTSPAVRSPFLAGILRPAIFLPATWDTDYDETVLHVILAHELAHHRRRDCAWTLLLRLTTALLWPQPLLWLLGGQLDQAAEETSDLMALTPDCPPRRYAHALLTLAERALPSHRERTVSLGVIPVRSSLGRRIQNVLDRRNLPMQIFSLRFRLMCAAITWLAATVGSISVCGAMGPALGNPMRTVQSADSSSRLHDQTFTFEGYGLKFFTDWGQHPFGALPDSPAAKAGIPTDHWVELVSINGRSANLAASALTALLNNAPPLHITFIDAGRTHTAVLRGKSALRVVTTAREIQGDIQERAYFVGQTKVLMSSLTKHDKQFQAELNQVITSTNPAFIRVEALERQIGPLISILALDRRARSWKSRQTPEFQAQSVYRIDRDQARLAPLLARESSLLPLKDASRQHLALIHAFAAQIADDTSFYQIATMSIYSANRDIRDVPKHVGVNGTMILG